MFLADAGRHGPIALRRRNKVQPGEPPGLQSPASFGRDSRSLFVRRSRREFRFRRGHQSNGLIPNAGHPVPLESRISTRLAKPCARRACFIWSISHAPAPHLNSARMSFLASLSAKGCSALPLGAGGRWEVHQPFRPPVLVAGDMQRLPRDILIAAWGDFQADAIHPGHRVAAGGRPLAGVRTRPRAAAGRPVPALA